MKQAENVVAADESKIDPLFDEEQFYTSEITPLMKALHEKCASRNIPLLLAVCFKNDEEKRGQGLGACFPGARTPIIFRFAEKLLMK